jgi:hypothetical protein
MDSQDEIDLDTQFKSFVVALTLYHLLKRMQDSDERKQVARHLLFALEIPVERSSRRISRDKGGPELDDTVVDRLERRLVRQWAETTPDTFAKAIEAVVGQGRYTTWTALRKHWQRHDKSVIRHLRSLRTDVGLRIVYILNELLDALYPLVCRLAAAYPNPRGERLFPWLILGGISPFKRQAERKVEAPYLVQRPLVEAMMDRFGRGFMRNLFERPALQAVGADDAAFWGAAKERLKAVLSKDGVSDEQFLCLAALQAPEPASGLVGLASAVGVLEDKAITRCDEPHPASSGKTDSDSKRRPPGHLAWKLLQAVGDQTFVRVVAGHFTGCDQHAAAIRNAENPSRTIRTWLWRRADPEPPSRDYVAGATLFLCQTAVSKEGWNRWLDDLSGEE